MADGSDFVRKIRVATFGYLSNWLKHQIDELRDG